MKVSACVKAGVIRVRIVESADNRQRWPNLLDFASVQSASFSRCAMRMPHDVEVEVRSACFEQMQHLLKANCDNG